uniref:Uncharacterized protein n=1 Tax=Cacopsylla melanoneura TaxID=428564 RepID=A0A8D9F7D3_9HEMI
MLLQTFPSSAFPLFYPFPQQVSPSSSILPPTYCLPMYPSHISLLNILFSSPRPPFLDPFFSHLSVFSHLSIFQSFPASPSPIFHSLFSLHLHHLSRRPFSSRPTPLSCLSAPGRKENSCLNLNLPQLTGSKLAPRAFPLPLSFSSVCEMFIDRSAVFRARPHNSVHSIR